MKVKSLGHVVLKVRNQQRAEEFYNGLLGFKIVTRNEGFNMTFFSFGESHHDFAIVAVGDSADSPSEGSTGLFHAAFKVGETLDDLKEAKNLLESNGVQVRTRDHHVSKSLYFNDPDGNPLEFYIDTTEDWKTDPDIIGRNGLELII